MTAMGVTIAAAELFGITEHSATVALSVEDETGPVDAEVALRIGGDVRARAAGGGPRLIRIEGFEPDTEYALDVEVDGASAPQPSAEWPGWFRTLPAPAAPQVGALATMNDLHFGEECFGGGLGAVYEDLEPIPADDTGEGPYWRYMNDDAIDDINDAGVDLAVIKGDIADRGTAAQFESAAAAFARFEMPHAAFFGNHDFYGDVGADGYAILGQPPAPRVVELAGWRLALVDSVDPKSHNGVFPDDRLAALEAELSAAPAAPTLVFMHHQPVPEAHARGIVNAIGMRPAHSERLFELVGRHAQVKGVLIGHTHRNRVRRYAAARDVPFVEVNSTKDYPGGWAHYRLFEDGSFRQEVRRTTSVRALRHSHRCGRMLDGGIRRFALGALTDRSYEEPSR